MAHFVQFQRASTDITVYIDPMKVSMVLTLRDTITRVFLSAEDHYVDVRGDLESVIATIEAALGATRE